MASKRRLRKRACSQKVKHETKENASAHAKHLGFPYVPYSCKFCSGWHVGRPDKRQRQSLRDKARHKRL